MFQTIFCSAIYSPLVFNPLVVLLAFSVRLQSSCNSCLVLSCLMKTCTIAIKMNPLVSVVQQLLFILTMCNAFLMCGMVRRGEMFDCFIFDASVTMPRCTRTFPTRGVPHAVTMAIDRWFTSRAMLLLHPLGHLTLVLVFILFPEKLVEASNGSDPTHPCIIIFCCVNNFFLRESLDTDNALRNSK